MPEGAQTVDMPQHGSPVKNIDRSWDLIATAPTLRHHLGLYRVVYLMLAYPMLAYLGTTLMQACIDEVGTQRRGRSREIL